MTVEALPSQDGVRILRVTGELDVLSARPLHDEVMALSGNEPLVLDLAAVTFLDSSGVHALNRLAHAWAGRGGLRIVAPPGGRPRRVLELVAFGDGLVADDLEQALAQLRH